MADGKVGSLGYRVGQEVMTNFGGLRILGVDDMCAEHPECYILRVKSLNPRNFMYICCEHSIKEGEEAARQ